MKGFIRQLPTKCTVLRDGLKQDISSEKLTPGDIVDIKQGDRVPADLRVIYSTNLKIDHSSLTGETDPSPRSSECTKPENFFETANLVFYGTVCKEGSGRGVVISIGDSTVLGQMQQISNQSPITLTPLRKEMNRFVRILSLISFIQSIVIVGIAALQKNNTVADLIILLIGCLIANVPESLVISIIITMMITARRLSHHKLYTKNLESVETLGSINCLFCDKTGTLTTGQMTVSHLWFDCDFVNLDTQSGASPVPKAQQHQQLHQQQQSGDTFRRMLRCGVIANSAIINSLPKLENGSKDSSSNQQSGMSPRASNFIGNSTDVALLNYFSQFDNVLQVREQNKILKQPGNKQAITMFNSFDKYQLAIIECNQRYSYYTMLFKGAPEVLWSYCSTILVGGEKVPINEQIETEFKEANNEMGKLGETVIGLAELELPKFDYPKGYHFDITSMQKYNFPLSQLTFLGLVSFLDPPKPQVADTILQLQKAGIKVRLRPALLASRLGPTPTPLHTHFGLLPSIAWGDLALCGDAALRGDQALRMRVCVRVLALRTHARPRGGPIRRPANR